MTLIAVVIVLVVVIIPVIQAVRLTHNKQNKIRKCRILQCWKLEIEQQQSILTGKWLPLDSEWSAFNQQVNDFNMQCES